MNRIVVQHYPVAKLPEELRKGIDPARKATVTVTEEEGSSCETISLEEIFAARKPPYISPAEIDEDIRRLRDDWDD
jgi:hypothetical protein